MKARLFCVVILGAVILSIANAAPALNLNEEEARKFADDASKKLIAYYDKLAADTLGLETEDITTFFNALSTLLSKSEVMFEVVTNASVLAKNHNFKDQELKYILKNLQKTASDESILGGDRYLEVLTAMGNLQDIASEKDIDGYKNESIGLSYFPEIQRIFATSNDSEEMEYYWNAWRAKNDQWAMGNFLVLVNGIKDAANLSGISAYEYWMKDFNMTQMDAVMTQIEPSYRQLHAFIRYQLNKKYGESVISHSGLIPDHLFQQALAQVWTAGSVIDEHFSHKDLPKYDEILTKNNYDTLKLFKMADKFYESMGLEAIPESYWGTRLKMKSDEDEGDCKATVLAPTANVYMQYCHKMDFRTFMQAHGFMSQIHFALEKPDYPIYYADSYDLDYAVGEAVILSASTPKHLSKIGVVSDFDFTEEVLMNRLMRLSIHTILKIPVYYVHTKMMANLFEGKVEMTELNKHYWELMDKYVGVGPPGDRVNNTFDFPFKFYLELNENEQARKFNSEVLSYQFYEKLCSISGQYPKENLQNCDFYGSKDAGDALKKMIKLGSSKPIHEVLAVMLPEDPKLNAERLLEYYSPALSWFTITNQKNNVHFGWTHLNKKIGSVKLPDICNGAPLDSNEAEARQFVEDASKKLFGFYDKLAADTMALEQDDLATFFRAIDTLLTKSEAVVEIVNNASKFSETKYKDEELNYILNKLKLSADEAILGGDRLFSILAATSNLEDLAADKDIPSCKDKNIELSYFPEIQNIFATSNDPEEMKCYWNSWREKNDKWAITNFIVLVNSIKDAANLTGISAYEFWMKDFNMTQMDEVMAQIQPFYLQLHGFIRHQLNKKYGDSVIDTKGLIPDHLFQQVLAQTWTNGSVLEENFPHKDLPRYDEILTKNNYDTMKLFKTANNFYESMGLEIVPESYWGTRLKMKSAEDEGDCKALILAETPNVFMQYCHKMDFRTFMQAHEYMAELHFGLEKSHLPAYYTDTYDLEHAVGEAVILSASTPKHLAKIGLISEPELTEEVLMNRLMRLSIHTMLNIPVYFVHTKIMADLFEGKVEMTELNKHYWELMDKYVGVGPPNDRVYNTFDFPYKFYLELNANEQARKFNSEVLSYQFYKKLCTIAGQYPKDSMQNCDFYGSKDAGDALKKMIKLGSSKPIEDVLASILPEDPKLNSESLKEYYSPIIVWLAKENPQNKINIGWNHLDKKIESVKLPEIEKDDD
ncbi:angiotensin-converting enzyme-like [Eupeodes corollae]|uniref:angiotensin-converting enzyme-like n=1 Tax=Eupeodes corollae TaxID=290404 RepID=UPI0024911904|nr:angiotensin-converting enzyme-like [Eupeodes corollae]